MNAAIKRMPEEVQAMVRNIVQYTNKNEWEEAAALAELLAEVLRSREHAT